ncbi:phage protein NinX family protein [Providencia manganoxydans]|uniref:phage protein NinX family protein n=1 Tax=Providencia manganoxydans TaxID=2923283 RepID=UPI0034E6110B
MNKYTELSDFEINKKVAEYIIPAGDWYVINKKTGNTVGCFGTGRFDPCNKYNDAMPIIIGYRISMYFVNDNIGWAARDSNTDYGELECTDKNYCRAAMILFLLMKDVENNQ